MRSVRRNCALFVCAALAASLVWAGERAPVRWNTRVADALQQGRKLQRPVFVYVTLNGCHYCRRMSSESLRDRRVQSLLQQKYVAARVPATASRQLISKYSIRIYPTTLVLTPQGKMLCKINGFLGPDRLNKQLQRYAPKETRLSQKPSSSSGN